jgi:hypothetical protein
MRTLTIPIVAVLLAGLLGTARAEINRNDIVNPEILAPASVSQGQFAALLCQYLKQATNEATYRELKDASEPVVFAPQDVAAAVEYLSEIGLVPYGGWQPTEALRRHHITSLIIRAYGAHDKLDIGDQDACFGFVESKGCDISTITRAIDCIWRQIRSSNQGLEGSPDSPVRGALP